MMPICRKQAFVIIPHAGYNKETISFFKTIGLKGDLYDNESKLEVKDEDDLSGSSAFILFGV